MAAECATAEIRLKPKTQALDQLEMQRAQQPGVGDAPRKGHTTQLAQTAVILDAVLSDEQVDADLGGLHLLQATAASDGAVRHQLDDHLIERRGYCLYGCIHDASFSDLLIPVLV